MVTPTDCVLNLDPCPFCKIHKDLIGTKVEPGDKIYEIANIGMIIITDEGNLEMTLKDVNSVHKIVEISNDNAKILATQMLIALEEIQHE
jgi:hypothetical protein